MDDQLTTGAAPRRHSRPKMSAVAATARRSARVGGGGATNLAAAAAWRDRLRALLLTRRASENHSRFLSCVEDVTNKVLERVKLASINNSIGLE